MARKKIVTSNPWWRQPTFLIVVVAGALIIFFTAGLGREIARWYQVRQQVASLQQDVKAEETKQHQLQELIDYLNSPTFQEREARLKLGLKKPGEQVIIVPPDVSGVNAAGGADSAANQTITPNSPDSTAVRWWKYFFQDSKLTHA